MSGYRPTHLAGSGKTSVGQDPHIVRMLIFWNTFLRYRRMLRCIGILRLPERPVPELVPVRNLGFNSFEKTREFGS